MTSLDFRPPVDEWQNVLERLGEHFMHDILLARLCNSALQALDIAAKVAAGRAPSRPAISFSRELREMTNNLMAEESARTHPHLEFSHRPMRGRQRVLAAAAAAAVTSFATQQVLDAHGVGGAALSPALQTDFGQEAPLLGLNAVFSGLPAALDSLVRSEGSQLARAVAADPLLLPAFTMVVSAAAHAVAGWERLSELDSCDLFKGNRLFDEVGRMGSGRMASLLSTLGLSVAGALPEGHEREIVQESLLLLLPALLGQTVERGTSDMLQEVGNQHMAQSLVELALGHLTSHLPTLLEARNPWALPTLWPTLNAMQLLAAWPLCDRPLKARLGAASRRGEVLQGVSRLLPHLLSSAHAAKGPRVQVSKTKLQRLTLAAAAAVTLTTKALGHSQESTTLQLRDPTLRAAFFGSLTSGAQCLQYCVSVLEGDYRGGNSNATRAAYQEVFTASLRLAAPLCIQLGILAGEEPEELWTDAINLSPEQAAELAALVVPLLEALVRFFGTSLANCDLLSIMSQSLRPYLTDPALVHALGGDQRHLVGQLWEYNTQVEMILWGAFTAPALRAKQLADAGAAVPPLPAGFPTHGALQCLAHSLGKRMNYCNRIYSGEHLHRTNLLLSRSIMGAACLLELASSLQPELSHEERMRAFGGAVWVLAPAAMAAVAGVQGPPGRDGELRSSGATALMKLASISPQMGDIVARHDAGSVMHWPLVEFDITVASDFMTTLLGAADYCPGLCVSLAKEGFLRWLAETATAVAGDEATNRVHPTAAALNAKYPTAAALRLQCQQQRPTPGSSLWLPFARATWQGDVKGASCGNTCGEHRPVSTALSPALNHASTARCRSCSWGVSSGPAMALSLTALGDS